MAIWSRQRSQTFQGLGAYILVPPFVTWGAPLPVALSCLPPLPLMTQAGSQGYLKATHILLFLVLGDSDLGLHPDRPELLPAPETLLFSDPQAPALSLVLLGCLFTAASPALPASILSRCCSLPVPVALRFLFLQRELLQEEVRLKLAVHFQQG